STCACCATAARRPAPPPPPCPPGCMPSSRPAWTPWPPPTRRCCTTPAGPGQVGWLGALAEVAGRDRQELEASLDRLEAREFLQRAPASRGAGEVEDDFRHVLVRDVAYGQVLRAERADKHRRAAAWIEALAPDRAEGRGELLAYHYRAALSFARARGPPAPGRGAPALPPPGPPFVRPCRRARAARAGRPHPGPPARGRRPGGRPGRLGDGRP